MAEKPPGAANVGAGARRDKARPRMAAMRGCMQQDAAS
jgi:hypothetical protein